MGYPVSAYHVVINPIVVVGVIVVSSERVRVCDPGQRIKHFAGHNVDISRVRHLVLVGPSSVIPNVISVIIASIVIYVEKPDQHGDKFSIGKSIAAGIGGIVGSQQIDVGVVFGHEGP